VEVVAKVRPLSVMPVQRWRPTDRNSRSPFIVATATRINDKAKGLTCGFITHVYHTRRRARPSERRQLYATDELSLQPFEWPEVVQILFKAAFCGDKVTATSGPWSGWWGREGKCGLDRVSLLGSQALPGRIAQIFDG